MSDNYSPATIAFVRENADIGKIVSQFVELSDERNGRRKGLCPLHGEKTPSFNIDVDKKTYHCFGCGEYGDAIAFLRAVDNLSFVEALRAVAETIDGYTLVAEDGSSLIGVSPRKRLVAAHEEAARYYSNNLAESEAGAARALLESRGFDVPSSVATFGCGYSLRGWDHLTKYLTSRKFTVDELIEAGLSIRGESGRAYDRFRGRLMWPILNSRGEHVGFGARKLFDDDEGAKYLNSPETPIYKKASTLYGLHLSRDYIIESRAVIVVEGYTDVMAAFAAGVRNVVASSGTAFGDGHIAPLKALLANRGKWDGTIAFSFDGDSAGRKAASAAWKATLPETGLRTFAIHTPKGMDPCEVRIEAGDEGVRELLSTTVPLGEFCINHAIYGLNLDDREDKIAAVKEARWTINEAKCEPIAAKEYAQYAAGVIGCDAEDILPSLQRSVQLKPREKNTAIADSAVDTLEREVLKVLLQTPGDSLGGYVEIIEPEITFSNARYRKAAMVILDGERTPEVVESRCATTAGKEMIRTLADEPLSTRMEPAAYGVETIRELLAAATERSIRALKSELGDESLTLERRSKISEQIRGLNEYRRGLM